MSILLSHPLVTHYITPSRLTPTIFSHICPKRNLLRSWLISLLSSSISLALILTSSALNLVPSCHFQSPVSSSYFLPLVYLPAVVFNLPCFHFNFPDPQFSPLQPSPVFPLPSPQLSPHGRHPSTLLPTAPCLPGLTPSARFGAEADANFWTRTPLTIFTFKKSMSENKLITY